MPTILPSNNNSATCRGGKGSQGSPQRARPFDFFKWRTPVFLIHLTKFNQMWMHKALRCCGAGGGVSSPHCPARL
jgi:hypothetical protein